MLPLSPVSVAADGSVEELGGARVFRVAGTVDVSDGPVTVNIEDAPVRQLSVLPWAPKKLYWTAQILFTRSGGLYGKELLQNRHSAGALTYSSMLPRSKFLLMGER